MRRAVILILILPGLAASLWWGSFARQAEWVGVDEAVVGKFAREAGRLPDAPFFDPGKGDLLLFLFLAAGAAGGFVGGYFFRDLFPPKSGRRPADA